MNPAALTMAFRAMRTAAITQQDADDARQAREFAEWSAADVPVYVRSVRHNAAITKQYAARARQKGWR